MADVFVVEAMRLKVQRNVRKEFILKPNPARVDLRDEDEVQKVFLTGPCQPFTDGRHGTNSTKRPEPFNLFKTKKKSSHSMLTKDTT